MLFWYTFSILSLEKFREIKEKNKFFKGGLVIRFELLLAYLCYGVDLFVLRHIY